MPNDTQTAPAQNGQHHPSGNPGPPTDPDLVGASTSAGGPQNTASSLDAEPGLSSVRGPVAAAWREGTLTRAQELDALCSWVIANYPKRASDCLVRGIRTHIEAARQAANVAPLNPKRYLHLPRQSSLRERAMSNLHAAEAHLLNIAPAEYLVGQMPSILEHVRRHLVPGDPRREELQRIGARIGLSDPEHPQMQISAPVAYRERERIVEQDRVQIVAAMRAASSASLREQVRVRNFRDVLVATTVVMTSPGDRVGRDRLSQRRSAAALLRARGIRVGCGGVPDAAVAAVPDDDLRRNDPRHRRRSPSDGTAVGPPARGTARAGRSGRRRCAAIRKIRGSSERYGVPLTLAALKLPTGAVTAVLGLLLMRGEFVPGLSALDTSAQILAWALVFGYAQQLFTRLVDQQGQTVLNSVRGASNAPASDAHAT